MAQRFQRLRFYDTISKACASAREARKSVKPCIGRSTQEQGKKGKPKSGEKILKAKKEKHTHILLTKAPTVFGLQLISLPLSAEGAF